MDSGIYLLLKNGRLFTKIKYWKIDYWFRHQLLSTHFIIGLAYLAVNNAKLVSNENIIREKRKMSLRF